MSNNQAIVRTLLIPISGGQAFLLPSAVVAEVTTYTEPERIGDNQPDWLLGIITWRNQRVPILSLKPILALSDQLASPERRIIILYGLEANQSLPFYGFIATDVPHVLTLAEDNLLNPSEEKRTGLVFSVKVPEKGLALLPDLTYLENLLRKSHILSRMT